jgi:O-antigen/teichoic acid export membrane protein
LIIVGCSLADEWKTRLVIVLFGMLTLFLSILIALFPALSDIALVKIWAIYAWVIGALCVAAGLSMKYGKPDGESTSSMPALP